MERAISSVEHFKRNAARFKITHIVISDVHNPIIKELENRVKIVKVPPISSDSRFRLIHRAIQEIESSHVLFLDDDDWLDESADCKILKAIQAYPSSTIFHFDSQYFYESGYDVTPGLVVPGTDVSSIFQFLNRIPFCSTVWPVDAIRKLPQVAFDDITLLEDLFLLLSVWSFGATPVFPQIRIAGVSVRTGENSKDLYAKSSWLTARATVAHHIASLSSFNSFAWAIVLPPKKSISLIFIASFKLIRKPSIVYHLIKTGVFPGILRGEIRPSELLAKARAFANSASLHSGKWK